MIDLEGWQFIPGPRRLDEPIHTDDCHEVIEHPIADALKALAEIPGIELAEGGYRLNGLVLKPEVWFGDIWGRTKLSGKATLEEIMSVWERSLPGTWLFQAGVEPDLLYTPQAFRDKQR